MGLLENFDSIIKHGQYVGLLMQKLRLHLKCDKEVRKFIFNC